MRLSQRLIAIALLAAISTALAGCSSGNFDPTDLMDWFDTKKKIPGERKPVFPDGVPGVEQGVPKELYKGAQQQDQAPVAETAPPPAPAPEPKAKHHRSKAAARSAPAAAEPTQDAAPAETEEGGAAAVPAAPPPPKVKRKRITAPPPEAPAPQAQQAAPPPSAPPSGLAAALIPAASPGSRRGGCRAAITSWRRKPATKPKSRPRVAKSRLSLFTRPVPREARSGGRGPSEIGSDESF